MQSGDSASNYVLSFQAELPGEARCVAADGNDAFVAATSKSIVTRFTRESVNQWKSTVLFSGEPVHGMISDLRRLKNGTFVSCGTDKRALVWNASGERLAQLVGEAKGLVSVDQTANGDFVTGDNAGTAVIWHKGRPGHRLDQHENAVAVAALADGEICTGSGTHTAGGLRIWKDGRKVDENLMAHQRIVKKVIPHPLGFATCANDGYVKVWARGPPMTCIMSCLAHPADETDSYVYSIELLPSLEIVSVGEDRYARIIAQDGSISQSLHHPHSVRDVTVLPNGDIVTACSDGSVRIWTQDPSRMATEEVRAQYEQQLEYSKSGMQSLDPSQFKPASVLEGPGSKPGEIVIVDLPGRGPIVFQWNADISQWDEIGEAMGKAEDKNMLDGVKYDHIVNVVVTEGAPALKLGFNVSDDPEAVARAFCTRYGLGEESHPQIVQYLQPFANPVARLQKQEQERQKLKLIPTWKQEGFIVDSKIVVKPLESAIKTTNSGLKEGVALSEEQMTEFATILSLLEQFNTTKVAFTTGMAAVVEHLVLHWPVDKLLPVLDLMRMLTAVHNDAVSLCENPEITDRLLGVANEGTPTHMALVLKIFGNWIAKRGNSPPVDKNSRSIQELLRKIVDGLKSGAGSSNAAVVSTFTILLHNILCFIGRFFKPSDGSHLILFSCMASSLAGFFQSPRNEKPTYMALLIVGTIAFLSSKQVVHGGLGSSISRISELKTSTNPSIRQAAIEAEKCCFISFLILGFGVFL